MIHLRHQRAKRRTLDDVFDDPDPMGLLEVSAPQGAAPSADQRLIATLQAIEAFFSEQGREPDSQAEDIGEATLGVHLKALRNNPEYVATLAERDQHNLLGAIPPADTKLADREPGLEAEQPPASPENSGGQGAPSPDDVSSMEEIWASDPLGLLDSDDDTAESIFNLKHVPDASDRDLPDDIAQRTPCDDFFRFEGLFHDLRESLRSGQSEAVRFQKESQIAEGDMFILSGMMCLVDSVGVSDEDSERYNPRLRVVFDNGTESNLLLRSLARALYKDEVGRRILQPDTTFDAMKGISHTDKPSGVIYILRSLSEDPALQQVRHLHKIGYTEKRLEARISGAERQQTYLEAPVRVAASFDCFNMDPRRFERLVHAMLHNQRVNVTLHSRDGSTYRPREWFDVELDVAREVVTRIVDGTIVQYRMNNTTGRLVRKRLFS